MSPLHIIPLLALAFAAPVTPKKPIEIKKGPIVVDSPILPKKPTSPTPTSSGPPRPTLRLADSGASPYGSAPIDRISLSGRRDGYLLRVDSIREGEDILHCQIFFGEDATTAALVYAQIRELSTRGELLCQSAFPTPAREITSVEVTLNAGFPGKGSFTVIDRL